MGREHRREFQNLDQFASSLAAILAALAPLDCEVDGEPGRLDNAVERVGAWRHPALLVCGDRRVRSVCEPGEGAQR